MKNQYVAVKTFENNRYLCLNPNLGFVVEGCNRGPYTFTNKKTAREAIKHANHTKYMGETGTDKVLTLDEYHNLLAQKLEAMERFLNEHGYETHRESLKLYVYLSGVEFGKPVHMWDDITLCEFENIKKKIESV